MTASEMVVGASLRLSDMFGSLGRGLVMRDACLN
jgi:hypothetical protein